MATNHIMELFKKVPFKEIELPLRWGFVLPLHFFI